MRGNRRGSTGSGDSLLGDEELEDAAFVGRGGGRERDDGAREGLTVGEREGERLSLELERGFKDDSDSGEEDQRVRSTGR